MNGQRSREDHVLKSTDYVVHKVHVHEPPVPDVTVDVLFQSDTLVVVNKPAGLPVHQSGPYKYLCVVRDAVLLIAVARAEAMLMLVLLVMDEG